MDWSKFTDAELKAISEQNWDAVSTKNLEYYVQQEQKGVQQPAQAEGDTSALAAFGKSALSSVIPTTTGMAGAIPGMRIGATAGSIFGPVGTLVGGAVGGIAGGIGGGYVGEKLQEVGTSAIPEQTKESFGFGQQQRALETKQHPKASFAGQLAPSLAFFRPGAIKPILDKAGDTIMGPTTQRIAMGSVGGGIEAGTQYATTGEIDPSKVLMAAAFQGIAATPTRLGQKFANFSTPEFDRIPTQEVLAGRIKQGDTRALRGIENDIHATHERAYNEELRLTRVNNEITSIEKKIATAQDPALKSALTDVLDGKKALSERLKTTIDEGNHLINRNEIAYGELADKLGVPRKTNLERAKEYATEAASADSTRATRRAIISGDRGERMRQAEDAPVVAASQGIGQPTFATPAATIDGQSTIKVTPMETPANVAGQTPEKVIGQRYEALFLSKTPENLQTSLAGKVKKLQEIVTKEAELGVTGRPNQLRDEFLPNEIRAIENELRNRGFDVPETDLTSILHVQSVNATRTPVGSKIQQIKYGVKQATADTKNDPFKVGSVGTAARPQSSMSPLKDSREVVEALLGQVNPDIPPTSSDMSSRDVTRFDVVTEGLIPLAQKGAWTNNAGIKYTSSVIIDANNRNIARRNEIFGLSGAQFKPRGLFTSYKFVADKLSFHFLSLKSNWKDFDAVAEVFHNGENRLDYEANLRLNGKDLTPHQADLYHAMAKGYEKTWEFQNKSQESYGKKHMIPNKLGYVAPMRKGDFAVTIKGGVSYSRGFSNNPDGTRGMDITDTGYVQRFFTLREANEFIKSFNALPDNIRQGQEAVSVEKTPQIENLFQQDMLSKLRQEAIAAGADSSIIARMDTVLREMIGSGGTLGSHHKKQMGFIEGAKGRELFYSRKARAESFRESFVDYVKEATRQMEKAEIQTKLDDLLVQPEMKELPNLSQYIGNMKEYSLNTGVDNPLEASKLKQLMDDYWIKLNRAFGRKDYHLQAHIMDSTLGKTTHAFYTSALTMRPSFWVAQASAFTVSFRSLVRDQGILAANMDISKGFSRLMMNDKELFNYFMWARKNTSSLHPEFINDLTKFGLFEDSPAWVQKMLGYITGETPSAAMDSLSRALSSSFFLEHYTKKGLRGEDLFRAVAKATDENMILYGKGFKAPVYARLGVIGDLISPLSTFSHAQLLNLANDIAFFKRNPSYQTALPAMVTTITTMAMGGAIGVVGAAEIELMIHAINYMLEQAEIDYRIPTLWEVALGSPTKELFGTENKFLDRTFSHGFMSASTLAISEKGYDIGSSNRHPALVAEIVTGDKNWGAMMPVLPWAAGVGGALTDALFRNEKLTEGERREVTRKLAPGWSFGFVDAFKFGSFEDGPRPHPKNNPDIMKSLDGAIANFLGTKTIDEQVFKGKRKMEKELSERNNAEAKSIINQIALNYDKIPPDRINKMVIKLATKLGKDPDEIFTAIFQTIQNSSIALEQLPPGVSKGLSFDANKPSVPFIGENEQ